MAITPFIAMRISFSILLVADDPSHQAIDDAIAQFNLHSMYINPVDCDDIAYVLNLSAKKYGGDEFYFCYQQ